MFYLLALGIGFVAGLRALVTGAVVAWAAYLNVLDLRGSPLAFLGSKTAVAIFSIFAVVELVVDLLPQTPRRTAPLPLGARIIIGSLCGAAIWTEANLSALAGGFLGATGGIIGAFAGYEIRRSLVTKFGLKDFLVALAEDFIAAGLACFLVSR